MTAWQWVEQLVGISSVSRHESAIADFVQQQLSRADLLEVTRVGDNVIARTTTGSARRLAVVGHLDTVPGAQAMVATDDRVTGLGATDMKGSLAVMLDSALDDAPRGCDVTYVFYAREEIGRSESGLLEIQAANASLLRADAAIVAEPTSVRAELGCQGNLRVTVTLHGVRAHAARPFEGVNAAHRGAELISRVAAYEPRRVDIDGVTFTEQLQVVRVNSGVANNVIPDACEIVINHRFAPDRQGDEAVAWLSGYLAEAMTDADGWVVDDCAPAAAPNRDNAFISHIVDLTGVAPAAKVGWTDVATFTQWGIPAVNVGAGDPLLAHQTGEYVTREDVDRFAEILRQVLA